MKSRSLDEKKLDGISKKLLIENTKKNKPALSIQEWFPHIWDERIDRHGCERSEVYEKEEEVEVPLREEFTSFDSLAPSFVARFSVSHTSPRWVNVLRFRDYTRDGSVATVYPPTLRNCEDLFASFNRESMSLS